MKIFLLTTWCEQLNRGQVATVHSSLANAKEKAAKWGGGTIKWSEQKMDVDDTPYYDGEYSEYVEWRIYEMEMVD